MSEREQAQSSPGSSPEGPDRRDFLASASTLAMAGGLAASYGTFAFMAGRFMYPSEGQQTGWVFVTQLARMRQGESIAFRAPGGERIAVARQGSKGEAGDFVALSSTCPHLGCQVHWEGQNERFFCPCHNGVFDPQGKGVSGPPGDAEQSLPRYPLKVEHGLLLIEVPMTSLQMAAMEPRASGQERRSPAQPDASREDLA
jgi:Rieske Fe-S protein